MTAEQAARYYGLEFDRKGWAICCFHDDKHASMSFKDGRFRCWACGKSGSSIDFVMELFGLPPMEAVKRINADFSLGLDLDISATNTDPEAARQRRERAEIHKQFEAWRHDTIRELNACIRVANLARPPLSEAEVIALQYREAFTEWADCLGGSADQQMAIFRLRNEVGTLSRMILKDIQKK